MKTNSSKNIKAAITAVGGFVPKDFISNQDLEKSLDTTDDWITTRTGIKKRRILKGEAKGTSYLGCLLRVFIWNVNSNKFYRIREI